MQRANKIGMMLLLGAAIAFPGCESLDGIGPDPSAGGEDLGLLLTSAEESGPLQSTASSDSTDANGDGQRDRDHADRRRHVAKKLFNELAGKIPSFGGLYRTERCSVAVVLTDMSEAERAVGLVEEALERLIRGCDDAGITVTAVEGNWTYKELMRIRRALRPLHTIEGVVGAGISFKENLVIVGVSNADVIDEVRAAIARLDVPADAIDVRVVDRTRSTDG